MPAAVTDKLMGLPSAPNWLAGCVTMTGADCTVNVAAAGVYTVSFRVSSPYGITDALHIANSAGTNLSGAVAVLH